ncbi:SDR family NAD(P)-dependent oxidoreductase [Solirubrobacter phytolaccae]|uniref:SDR family NAD(P)-dependent oxidoreductase n=1 Tax=Solirubrobacter phytolaccae TaxID=1404360 RepID=A0A9X3SEB6_9ACTN|nr:SDR family NAD(P)-dependent oxidoreductase [Solirubrobacter phytolaccae]MDA0184730.1 SDR family NAD(P)-dependent oxidoreductase [Solirubrobacter phytolaccae]
MMWNLDGRVALITGAASGIGAELARQLAARGMRLALIDVNGEGLERVAAGVSGAEVAVADVRDADALTAAIDDLAARCGGIDVAVANAGVATGGPLRMVAPETVEETIDINLLGVWRTARAALPYVLERRGYLLLIASAAAVLPAVGLGAYSVSKAGVDALGRTLRVELRTHGVGVGVGYFLFLNTPMVTAGEDSPIFGQAKRRLPNALGKTWPLEPAVARTVRTIEKRSRAVSYPPFLRGAIVLRGLLDNPLTDLAAGAGVKGMEEAFAAEAERVGPAAAARAVGGR